MILSDSCCRSITAATRLCLVRNLAYKVGLDTSRLRDNGVHCGNRDSAFIKQTVAVAMSLSLCGSVSSARLLTSKIEDYVRADIPPLRILKMATSEALQHLDANDLGHDHTEKIGRPKSHRNNRRDNR